MAPRQTKPRIVDVDAENFDHLPCCGITNPEHPGRQEKRRWFLANRKHGLRGKMILAANGKPAGYIEYAPGEVAWRGVEAPGYLVVHCIWVFARTHQRRGYGRALVKACLADAKASGKNGVAVAVRSGPWLAGRALYLECGFEAVDAAAPDFELLVRKLRPDAPDPAFKRDWNRKAAAYAKGLTIIHSGQCPHIAKFAADIEESARAEFKLAPRVVELKSAHDAQNAPTPYAVFTIIRDGKVVADHQISRARFRNIMKGAGSKRS